MQERLCAVDTEITAKRCVEICEGRKAENVALYDMRGRSIIADFFLICTGTSEPHIRAIQARIDQELSQDGIEPRHREGGPLSHWAILDYGDIIIHILDPERREYYRLEELWTEDGDAERSEEETDPLALQP